MKKTNLTGHLLALALPLLIPMTMAAAIMGLGTGPTAESLLEDARTAETPRARENALRTFGDLRRTTLYREVLPYLDDESPRVRDRAIRALEKMKNPEFLPDLDRVLVRAAGEEKWGEVENIIKAMSNMTYPHALPYFARYRDDESFPMKVRLLAGERYINTRMGLNAEVCFYSLGAPIYNKLGFVIYSQAMLFPAGQEMVREVRAAAAEGEPNT